MTTAPAIVVAIVLALAGLALTSGGRRRNAHPGGEADWGLGVILIVAAVSILAYVAWQAS